MKKLIIYDLDGTLVDTGEDIAEAVNQMLRQMQHGAALPKEAIRRLVGGGLHDLVQRCLQTEDPARIAQGTELFGAFYGRHLFDHSVLYPSVREALDYFRARAQAIVTNKPQPFAQDLIRGLGVADYFIEIAAGGSTYPKKPDPAAVLAIMGRAGVGPEETLMVGDSPIDIDTGRRAGVRTVIVTQGFADPAELAAANPDLLVENFSALLAVARERGW